MSYADLIIKGASVFAGKDLPRDYDFVAAKDGKIIACGKEEESEQYIGENTELIELDKDKLLMPGFFDSHVHLVMGGMYQGCMSLESAKSADEAAAMIGEFAKEHPGDGWIIGFKWYHLFWDVKELPTAAVLDRYVPDRPVFLMNAECHGAWVNTKAMEICGITRDTEDPPYGKIFRDENGEPTGYLDENALGLAGISAFTMPVEEEKKYVKIFQEKANSYGVTAVTDVMPFFGIKFGSFETYHDMDEKGELTMRVHGAPDLFGDMDEVVEASKKYSSDMYRLNNLKQFLDGVATTYTALLVEPYSDAPETCGATLMDLTKLNDYVAEAHKRGLSVKLHACGDATVRAGLDAYENAMKTYGDTGARHAIEHDEIIHRDDIGRFAELGVIASMQPEHVAITEDYASNGYSERLGPERIKFTWPIKTLIDSGAHVCFGTDCPVVSIDPFLEIYRGITRLFDDGLPEGGWNPQEKMSVEEALHGYTYESAYAVKRENELGTLEPGKFADMVVIDRNLLKSTPSEIREASALITIVNGKIVFRK